MFVWGKVQPRLPLASLLLLSTPLVSAVHMYLHLSIPICSLLMNRGHRKLKSSCLRGTAGNDNNRCFLSTPCIPQPGEAGTVLIHIVQGKRDREAE